MKEESDTGVKTYREIQTSENDFLINEKGKIIAIKFLSEPNTWIPQKNEKYILASQNERFFPGILELARNHLILIVEPPEKSGFYKKPITDIRELTETLPWELS